MPAQAKRSRQGPGQELEATYRPVRDDHRDEGSNRHGDYCFEGLLKRPVSQAVGAVGCDHQQKPLQDAERSVEGQAGLRALVGSAMPCMSRWSETAT